MLLYADPEADEAVAGYLNADEGVLELRHHALGLKTLDLFRRDPTGLWDSLRSTDTLDVADFLQVDSSAGRTTAASALTRRRIKSIWCLRRRLTTLTQRAL